MGWGGGHKNEFFGISPATRQKDITSVMFGNKTRGCKTNALIFTTQSKHKGDYILYTYMGEGPTVLQIFLFSKAAAAPVCPIVGCGKPTWNGEPDEYCSSRCKRLGPVPQASKPLVELFRADYTSKAT